MVHYNEVFMQHRVTTILFCRSTLDATKASIDHDQLDEIVGKLMTENNINLGDELNFEDFVKLFSQYREADTAVEGCRPRDKDKVMISRTKSQSRYDKAKSYKLKYNK